MSLGDHLEELRARLIYALVGVVVCTIAGLIFGGQIINFIELPYTVVMDEDTQLQTLSELHTFTSVMADNSPSLWLHTVRYLPVCKVLFWPAG